MRSVFVLTRESTTYSNDTHVINVFSAYELAEEWVQKNYPEYIHVQKARYGDAAYCIEEFILDAD